MAEARMRMGATGVNLQHLLVLGLLFGNAVLPFIEAGESQPGVYPARIYFEALLIGLLRVLVFMHLEMKVTDCLQDWGIVRRLALRRQQEVVRPIEMSRSHKSFCQRLGYIRSPRPFFVRLA